MRIVLPLFVVMVVAVNSKAHACGCGDSRSWQEVARSDALFIGQLVETKLEYLVDEAPWLNVPETLIPGLHPNYVKLVFEVERWWKGSEVYRVEVFTDRSSCALEVPDLGQTMLIEARKYRGRLFTSLCLRSLQIYSGGEVQQMASMPFYADHRLLTRDSLNHHLGIGAEPSRIRRWWYILAVLCLAGLLILRYRTKAA